MAYAESRNMPDGICLMEYACGSTSRRRFRSFQNCGFSLFTLFPSNHVWSLSPHEHFRCVEYRLSHILETSNEESSLNQNTIKVKETSQVLS